MPDRPSSKDNRYAALFHHQLRAIHSTKYIVGHIGGSGSGKTWAAPFKVYKVMSERPYSRSLAIGLAYQTHVERVMVRTMENFLKHFSIPYDYNMTRKSITLTNGAELLFGSSEKPGTLEGVHLDGICWIDECGQMPRIVWDVAQRRTAMNKGHAKTPTQIYLTSVPYLFNWLKEDVYDVWMKGDRDIEWIPCKTLDNKDFSKSAIERLKTSWREDRFRVFVLGEWAKPYGLIYPDPDDSFLWEDPFDVPDDWPAFAGHDFGFNNPTTGLWSRLSPDDVLHVVAEYEVPDLTMEEHSAIWCSWGFHHIDASWGDPTSPDLVETANNCGYPMEAGENAVIYGIDLVTDRMKTGRLKVWRGLKTFMDYRAQYVWAPDPHDENKMLDKPKKPQPAEHMMDALRYMCCGVAAYGGRKSSPLVAVRHRNMPDIHLLPGRRR